MDDNIFDRVHTSFGGTVTYQDQLPDYATTDQELSIEANARINVDSSITAKLNSEISTRKSETSTLTTNLANETITRGSTDAKLQSQIDQINSGSIDSNSNLAKEIANRESADEKLQTQIDTKLNSTDNAVSATKATNDAKDQNISSTYIKDITATNNSIVYTKGDGTALNVPISGIEVQINNASKDTKGIVTIGDGVNVNNGVISVTKESIGLANVEDKSTTDILASMTSSNVSTALGYTPVDPTTLQTGLDSKISLSTNQDVSGVLNFTNGIKINGIAAVYNEATNTVTFG